MEGKAAKKPALLIFIQNTKEKTPMRESRLFKIMYYLLDKGSANAPELARKFEVSVRTIYRDIEALSEAGIPVYSEPGRNGGIYLMKNFTLERAAFSEEEKHKILTALQSLNAAPNIDNADILGKLSALFKTGADDWLEADFSRWGYKPNDAIRFDLFKSAILNRQGVKIVYAGANGEISERIIQPLKLSYKSRSWYLKAYCTEKNDYRLFKLDRILDFKLSDTFFPPRAYPEPDEKHEGTSEHIVLLFPKEMTYRVYDEFDFEQIRLTEDGNLMVSAHIPVDSWLTGFLLSFGSNVTVLEPSYIKEILAKEAKLIYEKNKT